MSFIRTLVVLLYLASLSLLQENRRLDFPSIPGVTIQLLLPKFEICLAALCLLLVDVANHHQLSLFQNSDIVLIVLLWLILTRNYPQAGPQNGTVCSRYLSSQFNGY